jgi:hypothetical protein
MKVTVKGDQCPPESGSGSSESAQLRRKVEQRSAMAAL